MYTKYIIEAVERTHRNAEAGNAEARKVFSSRLRLSASVGQAKWVRANVNTSPHLTASA